VGCWDIVAGEGGGGAWGGGGGSPFGATQPQSRRGVKRGKERVWRGIGGAARKKGGKKKTLLFL